MVVDPTRSDMSVINQMLRDLDKQQPAASGSLAAASVVGSPTQAIAGRGQNLLRPLLFLLLAAFIGWLIWPLLQARLLAPVSVAEPKLEPTTNLVQPLAAASTSAKEPEIVVSEQPVTDLPAAVQTAAAVPEAAQTAAVEVAVIAPQPQPIATTKQTETKQTETLRTAAPAPATAVPAVSVSATPVSVTPVSATPIIETPAPVSDSEVYPAIPEADLSEPELSAPQLSAKAAASKQPSSMQVEKVVQDPKVVAAEQARAQQLQQLQQLLQLARQASQQQQWPQTLQLLQQIPPEFSSAESWQLQANAKQQLGDFSGALVSWQQLLLLQPQLAQAWLGKALAHEQLSQPQEARAAYQQAYALPGLSDASRQFIQQRLAQ
jgi:MSHA biogenesis protein MshN